MNNCSSLSTRINNLNALRTIYFEKGLINTKTAHAVRSFIIIWDGDEDYNL